MYVLEEISGLNSASFPNDQGRFTCMHMNTEGGCTGLVVRASDSGSGDPGSILGRVSVLFP